MDIRTVYYCVLDGHTPVPANAAQYQSMVHDSGYPRVALDHLRDQRGADILVSTLFLGVPSLGMFETMILGGICDQWQQRTSTWEKAEQAHTDALAMLRLTGAAVTT